MSPLGSATGNAMEAVTNKTAGMAIEAVHNNAQGFIIDDPRCRILWKKPRINCKNHDANL